MSKPLVPDELWALIEPLLPKHPYVPGFGKPRVPDRVCLTGIVFVLKTGLPWEDFPQEMGCCGMTLWNRLNEWREAGVWEQLHRLLLDKLRRAGMNKGVRFPSPGREPDPPSPMMGHPAVAETAVVGKKDPGRGEAVVAFVIQKEGQSVKPETLRDFCREAGLAQWKIPQRILLPKGIAAFTDGKGAEADFDGTGESGAGAKRLVQMSHENRVLAGAWTTGKGPWQM